MIANSRKLIFTSTYVKQTGILQHIHSQSHDWPANTLILQAKSAIY